MTQKPRVKIKRLPERHSESGGYNWDHGSLVFDGLKDFRLIVNKQRKNEVPKSKP